MQVLEGVQRRLRVKLTNEAGEVLPPGNFRVYGGAFCPGCAPAHFAAERTEEEWVLTMPGLKPGRVPWCWQVLAAEYASGVEWVLAGGEVMVFPRVASGAGGVDPGELELLATLDKTTLELTVTVGESTAACSMAAGDARASAIAADGSAKLAADSARLAEAARADAVLAKDGAEAARDGAQAAKADAVLAKDGAEAARDGAQAARGDAEAARDGALAARGGAEAAREGAEAARDDALAARSGAEDAREGAVLAAAEAKAAEAGAAGAADAVRFDLLPLTLEWLEGRLEKMYGAGMCSLALAADEGSLRVAFSLDMGAPQVEEAGALLDRVLPRKLVTEMEWADGFPVNYTRLEYLESTAGTYIKTGLTLNNRSVVESSHYQTEAVSSAVYGARKGSSKSEIDMWAACTTVRWGIVVGDDRSSFYEHSFARKTNMKHASHSSVFILNGVEYSKRYSVLEFETPELYVFAVNTDGKVEASSGTVKMLKFDVFQETSLVLQYIPALDETGTPCMYDTVNKKLVYNSGSGQFIAGVETMEQLAAVLRGLPDYTGQDGGELHLRLSDTLYETAVASGIIEETATAKNWQIAYDPTTEIAA